MFLRMFPSHISYIGIYFKSNELKVNFQRNLFKPITLSLSNASVPSNGKILLLKQFQ